jgi:hypothetical protein
MSMAFFLQPPLSSAYADAPLRAEPTYEIPAERAPLILSVNVTNSDAEPEYSSQILLSLSESRGEAQVNNVTYLVRLNQTEKNSETPSDDPQKRDQSDAIFSEIFFAPDGTASILMSHDSSVTATRIDGMQEEFLNAWIAHPEEDQIPVIRSPHITDGSTYILEVRVLTIDDISHILKPEATPRVEFVVDTAEDWSAKIAVVPEFPAAILISVFSILAAIIIPTTLARSGLFQGSMAGDKIIRAIGQELILVSRSRTLVKRLSHIKVADNRI